MFWHELKEMFTAGASVLCKRQAIPFTWCINDYGTALHHCSTL